MCNRSMAKMANIPSRESQLINLKQEMEILETQIIDLTSKIQVTPSTGSPKEQRHGTATQSVLDQVQSGVCSFLQSQSEKFVESVFLKYEDAETHLVKKEALSIALSEFNIMLTDEEVEAIMLNMDIDNNGGLDLKEFTRALNQPSTQVEQFVKTLPVSGMLARCLSTNGATEPLGALCDLSRDELKDRVQVFVPIFLQEVLEPALNKLRTLLKAHENEQAQLSDSKFSGFCMNAGSVRDFYDGPYKRIGEHTSTLTTHL
jgi:hypothetical protein